MDEKKFDFFLKLIEKAKDFFVSKSDANQFYSNVKFPREWKDFQDYCKDCDDCFVNASQSLAVSPEVKSLLKEGLSANNSSEKKDKRKTKRWDWVGACLVIMITLLGGVLFSLFYDGFVKTAPRSVNIVSHNSYDINCCDSCRCRNTCTCRDTCRRCVSCDSVSFSLDTYKWNIKDSVRKERCDNKEVTVGPKGVVSYSYRKFDKLIIVLGMLLTIGICTALVFFIISMRKTIATDQEHEKSELDHYNKLIDKYMEALLDEHRLKVRRCENILELSQQKQLFQMDVYQKEQDYWWKYIFRESEIEKDFLTSFLATVRTKSETTCDDKNQRDNDNANTTIKKNDTEIAGEDVKQDDSKNAKTMVPQNDVKAITPSSTVDSDSK